jgi:hypothetical protein
MEKKVKTTEPEALVKVVQEAGLAESTGKSLLNSFVPFIEQLEQWKEKAKNLVVTAEDQKEEMQQARDARIALKGLRVAADKKRKELKEDSLRYGRAVQGVYNVIEYEIKPIEEHLEKQEKFVELQEEKRKLELQLQRQAKIEPLQEYFPEGIDLAVINDDAFEKLLAMAQTQKEKVEEDIRKAEEERVEALKKAKVNEERRSEIIEFWSFMTGEEKNKELAEVEHWDGFVKDLKARKAEHEAERKRIEEENKKLQKQREAAERKRKKEEAEAARKLEEERKAREAAERKLEEEAERKRKEEEARKKEAEKLAKAPDKKKLKALVDYLKTDIWHSMATAEGREVVEDVIASLKNQINQRL